MTTASGSIWRFIVTPPLSGTENMAVDEALLGSFDPLDPRPLLRLYGWSPPALSLGRFQKAAEVLDLERCRADGIAVVRRVTGGGVIYHADELTYSLVCAPGQIPYAGSIKDSFRVLTGFLLEFYRRIGLAAGYAVDAAPEGTRLGERTAFCFAGRESFDIVVNGRKLGGNAQRRLKGIIFQHGSIPLRNRAVAGLSYMRDRTPEHAESAAALDEFGIKSSRESLVMDLAAAFSDYFGTVLVQDSLSAPECAARDALIAGRYSTDEWNLEGVAE